MHTYNASIPLRNMIFILLRLNKLTAFEFVRNFALEYLLHRDISVEEKNFIQRYFRKCDQIILDKYASQLYGIRQQIDS